MDEARSERAPAGARFLATGAYAGYLPWAPGTAGSLMGLGLVLIPGFTDPFVHVSLLFAVVLAGAYAAGVVAQHEGHRLTAVATRARALFRQGEHSVPDPSIVIIDEVAGMLAALLLLPPTIPAYGCAFILFRIFDIIKPPPARRLEAVPHGWGIMLDDLVAGVYANILTRILLRLVFPLVGW